MTILEDEIIIIFQRTSSKNVSKDFNIITERESINHCTISLII